MIILLTYGVFHCVLAWSWQYSTSYVVWLNTQHVSIFVLCTNLRNDNQKLPCSTSINEVVFPRTLSPLIFLSRLHISFTISSHQLASLLVIITNLAIVTSHSFILWCTSVPLRSNVPHQRSGAVLTKIGYTYYYYTHYYTYYWRCNICDSHFAF